MEAVPLQTATAYCAPTNAANSCSNRSVEPYTFLPRSVSTTPSISASDMLSHRSPCPTVTVLGPPSIASRSLPTMATEPVAIAPPVSAHATVPDALHSNRLQVPVVEGRSIVDGRGAPSAGVGGPPDSAYTAPDGS